MRVLVSFSLRPRSFLGCRDADQRGNSPPVSVVETVSRYPRQHEHENQHACLLVNNDTLGGSVQQRKSAYADATTTLLGQIGYTARSSANCRGGALPVLPGCGQERSPALAFCLPSDLRLQPRIRLLQRWANSAPNPFVAPKARFLKPLFRAGSIPGAGFRRTPRKRSPLQR